MALHEIFAYVAFGWLTFAGTMHFVIDVLAQYLRDKRVPGPDATLYYGLNTAYALGQILFGILGLLIARQAIEALRQWPVILLCVVAAAAWLAIGILFIEYGARKGAVKVFSRYVAKEYGPRGIRANTVAPGV
jgi:NAD(P)-dependent dehydrogenase (short-subunit alcohol dehydrogenase family)